MPRDPNRVRARAVLPVRPRACSPPAPTPSASSCTAPTTRSPAATEYSWLDFDVALSELLQRRRPRLRPRAARAPRGWLWNAREGCAKVLTTGAAETLAHADVAQLVAHHLAKVRVAGSNPVVRSEKPRVPSDLPRSDLPVSRVAGSPRVPAEWPSGLGKGLQSPVRGFDSRLRLGRLAQWESASLTRKRSLVQSQYRPPRTAWSEAPMRSFRPGRSSLRRAAE